MAGSSIRPTQDVSGKMSKRDSIENKTGMADSNKKSAGVKGVDDHDQVNSNIRESILNYPLQTKLRVRTTLNITFEGILHAACSTNNLVVVATSTPASNISSSSSSSTTTSSQPPLTTATTRARSGSSSQSASSQLTHPIYHVIAISAIVHVTSLGGPTGTESDAAEYCQPLPVQTSQNLQARAATALMKAKERALKQNPSVDREAQSIFDLLDKQFNARWQDKSIVVMDRVIVQGPGYSPDDCRAISKDGEGLLSRLKKLLEHEKRRATTKETKPSIKPAIPTIVPATPVVMGSRKGG